MRLLFVDDEPDILEFYKVAARFHGYENVTTAHDTESARLKGADGPFDLITLDLHMPGAGGLDLAPTLRQSSPGGVIAVISGHVPAELPLAAHRSIDVVFTKPIEISVLTGLFEAALQFTEARQRLLALGDGKPPAAA